jgi:hypothetical protein
MITPHQCGPARPGITALQAAGGDLDPVERVSQQAPILPLPMPATGRNVSSFIAGNAEMGDAGFVVARSKRNPAGWAVELMGSETFAYIAISDQDLVHAICEHRMRILVVQTKHLLENGVGPVLTMSGHE